ncbi:ABC transporter ATP-binding protein [Actinopolymorpha singaporensis]|uniref:ABC-2 type transport system ATP-binding protein n=1 Tax=Actinopolymorpha singaporensis TaxID=117157 RepID=A0A1H1MKL4_9ACTN|nr:ATP-binding cassette domain-containing protein [Actinopolymorpha singaporensis]SDR87152.1 ABC-2 type transport system ATP-binding protein [Actinopolymorpha singaporensis]
MSLPPNTPHATAGNSQRPLVRATGLVKEFRRAKRGEGRLGALRAYLRGDHDMIRAVDDVSFDIHSGELVGYLGPNGAGKSTTIKMLTGILTPTAGTLSVAGRDPSRERRANALNIGVVFGQRSQLWWDLPLRESFRAIRDLYGVPRREGDRRQHELVDLLDMEEFLDAPVRQLSLGQRMRGDLAAAMLYQPRLLFLDEPTVGLDVVAKERIREFVADVNAEHGTTVVLTTHDLEDVERLCRRIVLIDHGRVLYDGALTELMARYGPYRDLVVTLAEPADIVVDGAEQVSREGPVVTLRFRSDQVRAPEVIAAVTAAHAVVDLSVVEPRLEAVISRIYTQRALPQSVA